MSFQTGKNFFTFIIHTYITFISDNEVHTPHIKHHTHSYRYTESLKLEETRKLCYSKDDRAMRAS